MVFNSDGLNFVQNNHTKTECVYLREMVQVSQDSEQREATFNIRSKTTKPYICLSSTNSKIIESRTKPHILDTFKVNADNNECYLCATRL